MEKLDDVKINSQFKSKLFQERAKKFLKKFNKYSKLHKFSK